MTASTSLIHGLPLLVWVGHAAQATLVVVCAAVTWATARRSTPSFEKWERFWASTPWLATAACAVVVGMGAASILELWAEGFARAWAPVRLVALGLGERLPLQWGSAAVSLAVWALLVLWPPALRLSRSGRIKLALAVVCWWAALGWAAWSCRALLLQLPGTMAPTFLPFDALEPARRRFAHGALALTVSLGLGGSLVAWALWDTRVGKAPRRPWLGSAAVAISGAAAVFTLAPIGSRFAWENAHPFDPTFSYRLCADCKPQRLGLEGRGPDDLVQGPRVELSPATIEVDGLEAHSHEELYAILKNKRDLWRQLNPGRQFPGAVMLNVRALGTVAELEVAFRTLLRAGYPNAHLAFSEVVHQTRPMFGRVFARRDTARRVFLAEWRRECPAPAANLVHLGAESGRALTGWAHELGSKGSGNVCVVLPKAECPIELKDCRGIRGAGFEIVSEWSLGEHVEAMQLGRDHEEYQVAFIGPKTAIEIELMNDPRDPWNGFEALKARLRGAGRRLVWAMNAGMYHPDRSPVGLLVSGSEERAPLNTQRGKGNFFLMPNGVFEITRFGPGVQTSSAWLDDIHSETREATQSGPMLVIGGQLHPAFERDSPSRLIRNGVGVAGNQVVMAISTTRVNFYEFASLMRHLGCANALYLDGNVSSVFAPELGRKDPGLELGPVLVVSEAAE